MRTVLHSEVTLSNRTFLKRVVVAAVLALSSLAAAQPANDLCANAEVISATGAFPKLSSVVNLTGATSDPASPISCQGNNNSSVWYSFTPTTTGVYTIQNCTPCRQHPLGHRPLGLHGLWVGHRDGVQ